MIISFLSEPRSNLTANMTMLYHTLMMIHVEKIKKTVGAEVKGEVVQIDMVMDSLTSTFSLTLAWVI